MIISYIYIEIKVQVWKQNQPQTFYVNKTGLVKMLLLGLLGEATVVGCKVYSVTSDPKTQKVGPEERNGESEKDK